jgi:hypothetical protein
MDKIIRGVMIMDNGEVYNQDGGFIMEIPRSEVRQLKKIAGDMGFMSIKFENYEADGA